MKKQKRERSIIKAISIIFLIAALSHLPVFLGVWEEEAPSLIKIYFNSLIVFGLVAFWGLWNLRNYGRIFALIISSLQVPAHGFVLILQILNKQIIEYWRFVDVAVSVLIIIYLTRTKIKRLFN